MERSRRVNLWLQELLDLTAEIETWSEGLRLPIRTPNGDTVWGERRQPAQLREEMRLFEERLRDLRERMEFVDSVRAEPWREDADAPGPA